MVRLDRKGVVEPRGWRRRIARAFADADAFLRRARAFERLALNGKMRRAGFLTYGSSVLPGDFPALWRRSKALKKALHAMTKGHGAYCQKAIEQGHVEHWKPKSLFPTLVHEVGNYFLSCARCNEAKSDNWPPQGAYVRPDEGEPAARFVFDDQGYMRAVPGDKDARVTIKDVELNRKWLRRQRRAMIKQALGTLGPILEAPGMTDALRVQLAKTLLVSTHSPFSEAINQNVRRAWSAAFPGLAI